MKITSHGRTVSPAALWIVCTLLAAPAIGSGRVVAQRSKPPSPAPSKPSAPAPALSPPQIAVAGIRVVGAGAGAGASGSELRAWQNPRQSKVPFNVTMRLSLPAGSRPATTAEVWRGDGAGESAGAPVSRFAPATDVARTNQGRGTAPSVAPAPGDGAESVEAVVKQIQAAAAAGKGRDLLAVIYPDDRPLYAMGVAMAVAGSPMPFVMKGDKTGQEKVEKDADALLAKHKIKQPLFDPSSKASLADRTAAKFKDVDLAAFLTDATAFLKTQGLLEAVPLAKGSLQDIKVSGNSAVAKVGEHSVEVTFVAVNGRWFMRAE